MKLPLLAALAATSACFAACRTTGADEAAELKVANGTPVLRASYPFVALLEPAPGATCSGTFLNDTTVLTAAHCVKGPDIVSAVPVKTPDGGTVAPLRTFVMPGYSPNLGITESTEYDLALLVYPAGTGAAMGITSYPKIASSAPYVGQQVTLLGFGASAFDGSGAGQLRLGSQSITAVDTKEFGIIGELTDAYVLGGDSGSAVLSGSGSGEILGVTSVGGNELLAELTNKSVAAFRTVAAEPAAKAFFASAVNCSSAPCAAPFPGSGGGGGVTPPPPPPPIDPPPPPPPPPPPASYTQVGFVIYNGGLVQVDVPVAPPKFIKRIRVDPPAACPSASIVAVRIKPPLFSPNPAPTVQETGSTWLPNGGQGYAVAAIPVTINGPVFGISNCKIPVYAQ